MNRKKALQSIVATIGLLVLIFDSKLALKGASAGLNLCIRSVIPSLFPFFVLSMYLTESLSESNTPFLHFFEKLFRIPKAAVSAIVPGFLGGYPVGANCVGDLYQRNQITKKEAERMLAFCSNAGPSFLFGIVSGFFPDVKTIWLLWIINIFSAFLTAITISNHESNTHIVQTAKKHRETEIVFSAAKAMVAVCCWVILFRSIITFLDVWILWRCPKWMWVLFVGILELTNGCCELLQITDIEIRFVLCACILSFGGICVLFQVASVTRGLSIGCYVKGKLIQTMFAFILSHAVITKHGRVMLICIPLLIKIFRKTENRYSNQQTIPV